MSAFFLPLEVHRNGSHRSRWQFIDTATRAPLNLVGATFLLRVRRSAGAPGSPIATATIVPIDLATGVIEVTLLGSAFASVQGTQERVTLAWDIVMTQGGVPRVLAYGPLHLMPGVT